MFVKTPTISGCVSHTHKHSVLHPVHTGYQDSLFKNKGGYGNWVF